MRLTEGDSWVLLTDVVTLVLSEEHVGRETTLWGVWVLAMMLVKVQ